MECEGEYKYALARYMWYGFLGNIAFMCYGCYREEDFVTAKNVDEMVKFMLMWGMQQATTLSFWGYENTNLRGIVHEIMWSDYDE